MQEELKLLKIRNLIASREMNTAEANRELDLGGWLSDHSGWDKDLQMAIQKLFDELEAQCKKN